MNSQQQNQTQFASLYVGDLKDEVTEAHLYEIFNAVGPVASIRVCRDSVTRKSLGYAYVNFYNVSDAERALDTINYSPIKGRACRVMWSHRDPNMRKQGQGNVFVKNLAKTIDSKALYDTFSLFGNILTCKVAIDEKGNSRGYGFVHFETEESGKTAIQKVNGKVIAGKEVYVGPHVKVQDRSNENKSYTNIYAKHFPAGWDEKQCLTLFEEFGTITSSLLRDDKKGRSFLFVNFEDPEAARLACEGLHGKDMREGDDQEDDPIPEGGWGEDLPEHRLYVRRAQSKQERMNMFKKSTAEKEGVNLYIKNIEDSLDDVALKELFQPFGTITSASVARDEKGNSKGFGFVCFKSPEEATKAVTEMHLKMVSNKPLYVGLAEKRETRMARLQQRYRAPGVGSMGMGGMPVMNLSNQMFMQMRGPPMGYPGAMGGMMGGPYGGMQGGPQRGPNPNQGMRPGMMMGMQGMQGMMNRGPMVPNMMNQRPGMRSPMRNPGVMPQNNMNRPMRPQQTGPQQSSAPFDPAAPLTAAALASAPPGMQKQMLGEKLFPLISRMQPEMAGKITGMMLEMDNSELLILLESPDQLQKKVEEALRVLETPKMMEEKN